MKQSTLVLILLVSSVAAFGQIKYEPGYIISNDGKRTECEIKNLDWQSNPNSFDYRVNGVDGKGDIQTVAEFGITGGSVFRRFTVDIDRSSNNTSSLTKSRKVEFTRETLFLRLLVNGKAVLYMYEDSGLIRFFYMTDEFAISQLVYKRYLQSNDRGLETGFAGEYEQYKQDLLNKMKCGSISKQDVETLKYERANLMKFFDRYNECTGTSVQTNEAEKPASPMHLGLLVGMGFNNFSMTNGSSTTEFQNAGAPRFGAELEVVLPFNKGMWSVIFQPVYQTYSSQNTAGTIKINYSSLDLGLGVRRSLIVKNQNSLYATFGAVYAFPFSSTGAIKYPPYSLNTSSGLNVVAGIGFRQSKFSVELSYAFRRELLGDYIVYSSTYNGVIVMLGYRLK